jgi:signal transduction histidine kinase/ADP-ribose pyrophosphatase YjhB (NUDIX family)
MASAVGVAMILRDNEGQREVLLACRDHSHSVGAGLWSLPGGIVRWSEDIRATVRREVREKIGLKIKVGSSFETLSGFVSNQLVVVTSFFTLLVNKDKAPRPGPRVERVAYFPLSRLPELAFETDVRALQNLAQASAKTTVTTAEALNHARVAELESKVRRHERRYDELMDLYMQELMRGAWINDLLVQVASTNEFRDVVELTVEHLTTQSDLGLARIWLPGPPDNCETCAWADQCPQKGCLHLISERGDDRFAADKNFKRIPPIPGTPAGDTALRSDLTQSEIKRSRAQPSHFEGFPLDVGLELGGVLGIYGLEQREPGERRIFQFVARAISGSIKNARLHQELKRSDQVKRIFIDKMSHSLKTPLTVILGYAELIKEDCEASGDGIGAEGAAAIEKSGRDLYTLVESILFITKLESGRLPPKKIRCDACGIIEKVIKSYAELVDSNGTAIHFDGQSDIIFADPQWVKRIVEELLSNAVKFTKGGDISIYLSSNEKNDMIVAVHDTGIGMAKTNRSRIFEPFTQGTHVEDDYQVNLNYGGLGVGLAIARTLVVQSGGSLWVESIPGQGSRFFFSLPRSMPG